MAVVHVVRMEGVYICGVMYGQCRTRQKSIVD